MERSTPVGRDGGSRLAVLALAAGLVAGPMTAAVLHGADTPAAAPAPAAKVHAPDAPKPTPPPAPTPEQIQQEKERKAAALLTEAKQAYEQKNYGPSVAKYREFLAQNPKGAEATAAHFGLAMSLAAMPDRDWNAIAAELQPIVDSPDMPDKGRAQYWLGAAIVVTGQQQLAGVQRPAEQRDLVAKAMARIEDGAGRLAAAARTGAGEWAARSRVDAGDAYNQCGKCKEAAELTKPFVTDPALAKGSLRPAALLVLGEAQVRLHDYPAAFATLAGIAPFDQLDVGLNARYLLGTILQETGERPEAVLQYEAVFKGHLEQRRKAEEALRNKEAFRDRPLEQLRLAAVTRGTPEYVAASMFNAANIQFEFDQFADAAAKYQSFLQAAPRSELAPIAQLRQGICQVQLKQPDGARTLQTLMESPTLGDQATWWVGRLQRALAEPTNPAQQRKMVQAAIVTFGRAGERAAALGKSDPVAAARHNDILLDIADSYVILKQYKEAAPLYETIAKDKSNPQRAEIAHEHWAMALDREGQYAASDAACASFVQQYPKSMLRPLVMFWQAENSYRQGVELAKKPETTEQAKALQEKAAAQYQAVVEKYPEFAQASAARYGLGMAYYRQGEWEKASKQLERILDADRVGELASVSYYQADCLIRTMPQNADDALSAARLSGALEESAKLLSAFVGGEERPETPDAMLKLADCYQRNAAILADQQEKTKALQSARETYDKLLQKYPRHPAFAEAVMERARCMAATGDPGGSINELNRFRNDAALAKSDVAPMALMRLSELMVRHGRAVDAAAMLEKARKDYEPILAKDPKRSDWIAGLRYQHGLALKESGKSKEALALFGEIIKEFKDRPEAAEASLASIQVRKDEALAKLRAARQAVAAVPMDQPVDAKLTAAEDESIKQVEAIAGALGEHADRIADQSAGSDLHVRTLRDAANSWRAIADTQIETIRRAKSAESLNRLKEKLAKDPKVGKSNSVPRPPQIKLAAIPVQPAEQKARDFYNKALDAAPDSPVCNELRLELAQMYTDRGEWDSAIQLLNAAIDKNPPPGLQNELHVKLGNAFLMKKDAASAMNQALQALTDANSTLRPAAYLVKGRALMIQKNWAEAITVLSRYRAGSERYLNAGPVTEEGLVRLAEAYAAAGNWEQSRTTYEHLIGRFGGTKWLPEARFGIGLAFQQAKQYDRAVEAYTDVTRRTSSEMAARAQLQIGLCRAAQKRWQDAVNELLLVPGTYDYAEWAAHATLEAGNALVELKQPAEAKDVLNRVVRDHPGTEWAQKAQKRLAEIQ